jgi:hypothetical protein
MGEGVGHQSSTLYLQSAATLTRVQVFAVDVPTGSRTHPWLYSGIPRGFNRKNVTRTSKGKTLNFHQGE